MIREERKREDKNESAINHLQSTKFGTVVVVNLHFERHHHHHLFRYCSFPQAFESCAKFKIVKKRTQFVFDVSCHCKSHNSIIASRVPTIPPPMAVESDEDSHWETLERALNEMEVLRAIYGIDDEEGNDASSFAIVSPPQNELDGLRRALGMIEEDDADENDGAERPQLTAELRITIQVYIDPNDDEDDEKTRVLLGFRLPKGYPETSPAFVTSLQTFPQQLHRNVIDETNRSLNERAKTLLGSEAIMDLVEDAKNMCLEKQVERIEQNQLEEAIDQVQQPQTLGRRWIWVHHITKSDRISSILNEALDHNLTGILKHGYPGVVLVEGTTKNCDKFVKWIKADKSTEGGFGRNWGHHVRGEISIDARNLLETTTMHSTDDLGVMAHHCREAGLEDEFREYVLQHK